MPGVRLFIGVARRPGGLHAEQLGVWPRQVYPDQPVVQDPDLLEQLLHQLPLDRLWRLLVQPRRITQYRQRRVDAGFDTSGCRLMRPHDRFGRRGVAGDLLLLDL